MPGGDEGDAGPSEERPHPRARGLTLLSIVALVTSLFAVPTLGIGAGIAVILLVASWLLYRRGYAVRRVVVAAIVSLVLSGVSAGACWKFVLLPAEVEGEELQRQTDVELDFDRAFEDAAAPPPPRGAPKE